MTDPAQITEFKHKLRTNMKTKLQAVPMTERLRLSQIINTRLFYTPQFKMAKTIATTISHDWEVHTDHTILAAWGAEKTVVVPRMDPFTKTMSFHVITDLSDLETGHGNTMQPKPHCPVVSPDQISLMLVPGLLFDRHKNRLGQGGGYFDRYLAGYTGDVFALAYDLQVVDKRIPTLPHDQPVTKILTESEIF